MLQERYYLFIYTFSNRFSVLKKTNTESMLIFGQLHFRQLESICFLIQHFFHIHIHAPHFG